MNFSGVPPLADFGNTTALGVAMAFVYSVTFLPALLAVLPARARPGAGYEGAFMRRLGEFVVARRTVLLWGFSAVALIMMAFLPRNEFRNNWVKWFSDRTEFQQDLRFVSENLSGINAIEFSMPSQGSGGISSPEYLKTLDAFATWLRGQEHVHQVGTLADIMKRLNMNMHGDDKEYYRIPDSQELAAQYLLLYELSLPYGMDLNNQINIEKSATRLTVITADIDSTETRELAASAEAWLLENAPPYMATLATGNAVMFASIAERTILSMIITIPLAMIGVSLTLAAAFRSVRYGLLSLIPNLVPIAMAFGLWGLLIGRINFGVACVAALSMGIVVDDTVHFLSKYLWARRNKGYNAEDAVRYAFETVGRALAITSVVLVAGFLILTLSSFQFNANMGLLAAIAVTFALASDLLFLPPILMIVDRERAVPESFEDAANRDPKLKRT